jgi:hypothetical protein
MGVPEFGLRAPAAHVTLEGHEAELDNLAGERATLKGEVTGETVAVQSVVPAKKG